MTKYQQKIKRLEEKIEEMQRELVRWQQEEKRYLSGLTETCPSYKGNKTERYTDAAGSGDYRDCRTCRGLGVVGPIKCECGNEIATDMIYIRRQNLLDCPWCGRRIDR